jgi:secondary thiamine-phosphate synthase enzyme
MKTIMLPTTQKTEVVNITEQLAGMIAGVDEGLALFSVPHTTAALIVCEDDDELRVDIVRAAEEMFAGLRPFQHRRNNNPNTEAHLVSALAGTSLALAVVGGQLQLGTYQNVLLLEMDGPKTRELRCFVLKGTLF